MKHGYRSRQGSGTLMRHFLHFSLAKPVLHLPRGVVLATEEAALVTQPGKQKLAPTRLLPARLGAVRLAVVAPTAEQEGPVAPPTPAKAKFLHPDRGRRGILRVRSPQC